MVLLDDDIASDDAPTLTPAPTRRSARRRAHQTAMRPRRLIVKVHRWLSLGVFAWVALVTVTGGWLVFDDTFESWLNAGRYDTSPGDIGPQAAADVAADAAGPETEIFSVVLPRNGRGVYQVGGETPLPTSEPVAEGEEPPHEHFTMYIDPGSGEINDVADPEGGFSWWFYRGHMYLWQDWGPFNAFHPDDGWCTPDADGVEPGGPTGVVCDVLPNGQDIVGWLGVGFIVILLTGFYLWYWPGVRRWATAFVVKRGRGAFTLNLGLHKVVGFVVWIPLLVVAFTGIAFAFPNLNAWYDNVTPARRDFFLWSQPEDALSGEAEGRDPLTYDEALVAIREAFPGRAVNMLMPPFDETATWSAWVTRGFDPWTREGGAGNTYVAIDQYSGDVVYDGIPGEGNAFDQAWDDWQFPLHTGDFGGTTTRVLWTGLAMTPLFLGVTGILMWLIRRKKRSRRRTVASPT